MASSSDSQAVKDEIDLDRVVVDPIYRRRVIERLRVEAARRPVPLALGDAAPPPRVTRDD